MLSQSSAKPVMVLKPQDMSVGKGESAQFYCEAKGDPMPAVEWSREQGPLPNGRSDSCIQLKKFCPLTVH